MVNSGQYRKVTCSEKRSLKILCGQTFLRWKFGGSRCDFAEVVIFNYYTMGCMTYGMCTNKIYSGVFQCLQKGGL